MPLVNSVIFCNYILCILINSCNTAYPRIRPLVAYLFLIFLDVSLFGGGAYARGEGNSRIYGNSGSLF